MGRSSGWRREMFGLMAHWISMEKMERGKHSTWRADSAPCLVRAGSPGEWAESVTKITTFLNLWRFKEMGQREERRVFANQMPTPLVRMVAFLEMLRSFLWWVDQVAEGGPMFQELDSRWIPLYGVKAVAPVVEQ